MAISAKALREKRAPLAARMREMTEAADGRDFTAEEQSNWEAVNADYDALTRQIERAESTERAEAQQLAIAGDARVGRGDLPGRPAGDGAQEVTEEHRCLALQAWARTQVGRRLTERHTEACRLVGLNPGTAELDVELYSTEDHRRLREEFSRHHPSVAMRRAQDYRATMTGTSGPAGGYIVAPETLVRRLEVNMLAFGGMAQVAETLTTATGERMSWPTADDTTNTGALLGESTSIGSSVDPSFTKVFWDAYKFSSKPVLVPFELLEDTVFNLPVILGDMLGERLGRVRNTYYTTGTGASQPKGIITCASAFSAASATAIAADDLFGLVHSIDPAYRSMPGSGFMMHDSILLVLRKLKDGEGNYLWQSGMNAGSPDRLLTYPLTNNQDMDSTVASGKKSILFGVLSRYKIRRVNGMRVYRLEERYRDVDQTAFLALVREDGNYLTSGTSSLKYLSH